MRVNFTCVNSGKKLCTTFTGQQNDESSPHDYDWRFTFASAEADLFYYHEDKKALGMAYVTLKYLIKLYTSPSTELGKV